MRPSLIIANQVWPCCLIWSATLLHLWLSAKVTGPERLWFSHNNGLSKNIPWLHPQDLNWTNYANVTACRSLAHLTVIYSSVILVVEYDQYRLNANDRDHLLGQLTTPRPSQAWLCEIHKPDAQKMKIFYFFRTAKTRRFLSSSSIWRRRNMKDIQISTNGWDRCSRIAINFGLKLARYQFSMHIAPVERFLLTLIDVYSCARLL